MFHDGDLRSGIALSLSQQKLLTCFVYAEDDAVSTAWQSSLTSQADQITKETVILKFTHDSQEAHYLNTFCPITKIPTIVVMKYGAVIEKLETPMEVSEVLARFTTVLSSGEVNTTTPAVEGKTVRSEQLKPDEEPQQAFCSSSTQQSQQAEQRMEQDRRTNATTDTQNAVNAMTLQNLLPERAARLEADQATKQAEEKAARIARSEARRREAAEAIEAQAAPGKGKQRGNAKELGREAVRADWVRQQAKRKEQAKLERERILQQIESDKQERRHKASVKSDGVAKAEHSKSLPLKPQHSAAGQDCSLQVRLLDGSSVRRRFAASATLAGDVRAWVKDAADTASSEIAYSFRLLQPPQPSITIEIVDEQQTLSSLGLLPSATLVLVPSSSKPANNSILTSISNLFTAIFASIIGFLSIFLGAGGPVPSSENTHETTASSRDSTPIDTSVGNSSGADTKAGAAHLRTNTLASARSRESKDEPTEFYNGNSSAFEARKDNTDETT